MTKKIILSLIYFFTISPCNIFPYETMLINDDNGVYRVTDDQYLIEDKSSSELITEDRLKEIIEEANLAPLPEETVELKDPEKLLKKNDDFSTDVEIVNELKSTFDRYNFSNKSNDIHVGRINANEFTSDRIIDNGEVGVGISYSEQSRIYKERAKEDPENWQYTPVYATGKYKIGEDEDSVKYLKFNLGYSFREVSRDQRKDNDDRLQGGMYYGVGGGMDFRDMSVGVMYQVNKDGIEKQNMHKDDSRVTFSVDYKLGL